LQKNNNKSSTKTIHNELLALGKSLSRIDEYLMKNNIKRDVFKSLKATTLELFLKEVHDSLIQDGKSLCVISWNISTDEAGLQIS